MTAISLELAWGIIAVVLIIGIYVCAGFVCGRICVQLIRSKNPEMSEVLWFWLGFLTNIIGVVLTLIVKDTGKKVKGKEEKEDEETEEKE